MQKGFQNKAVIGGFVLIVGIGIESGACAGIAIAFEFSPPDVRPTYIGLNNTINGIAAIVAPIVGAVLASVAGYRALFVVAIVVSSIGIVMMRWWVQEPRFES